MHEIDEIHPLPAHQLSLGLTEYPDASPQNSPEAAPCDCSFPLTQSAEMRMVTVTV